MSMYTTLHGDLIFNSASDIDFVVGELIKHEHAKKIGNEVFFIDELGELIDDQANIVDGLTLSIPFHSYRNLSSRVLGLANKFKPEGTLHYFSMDGVYSCGTYHKKKIKAVYGADDIMELVFASIHGQEDYTFYEESLKLQADDWEKKYPDDHSHAQTVFELLELGSTLMPRLI